MKAFSLILIPILWMVACTPEKDSSTKNNLNFPQIPPHISKKIEHINYLDSLAFAKVNASIQAINKNEFELANPSNDKLLFEKACRQSKGYQKGIWEGENDCSWVVEKKNLEKFGDWASRQGDTLILKLKNKQTIQFVHDRSVPDQTIFFQFKNYLPQAGFIAIEEIHKGKCRSTNLVNENDGNKFTINGSLYFSKDQNKFLASTFNYETPLRCTNKIELYNLSDKKLTKLWHIPTGKWGVTNARLIDQKQILIEQSTTGIPPEYKFYAKVSTSD